jgi:hypothetical protein
MKRFLPIACALWALAGSAAAQTQFPAGAQNTRGQTVDVQPTASICAGGVPCAAGSPSSPTNVTATPGAFVDGALSTMGFTTDTPCASDTATCSEIALLKRENQRLTSLISALGTPFQAGGNIGNTSFAATQSGTWSFSPNGSVGVDRSANKPTPPNVGSNFGGTGPYANYVLVETIPVNANRNAVDCENATGAQIVIERDDGTVSSGSAPANATVFPIGGGAGTAQQGGSWSSTTFRGRIQVFAPAALSGNAFLACMED